MDSPMPVLHQSSFQACSAISSIGQCYKAFPSNCFSSTVLASPLFACVLSQLLLQYTQGGGVLPKAQPSEEKEVRGASVLKKCKGNGVSRGL
ncbi:hypothetical protein CMEL01_07570 [Colletotrichum melonis]|uniref:Uncharacterized protein n=1 Tax=Colletotrichum melonis TaxID=1209925 RepID=A0AAI9U473_9PEZI|nr:hypothetical protein CMEL01_07570 [Colletotrichum melonis]